MNLGLVLAVIGAGYFVWWHFSGRNEGINQRPVVLADANIIPSGQSSNARSAPASTPDGSFLQDARSRLVRARAIPHSFQRAAECIKIIAELCKAGHSEEAWQLIEKNPGQTRDSELSKYFASAGLSKQEFLDTFNHLPYRGDELTALLGYFNSLDQKTIKELSEDPEFRFALQNNGTHKPDFMERALAGSLAARAGSPLVDEATRKNMVHQSVDFHNQGLLDDTGLAQVVQSVRGLDSFHKWRLLADGVESNPAGSYVAGVRKGLVEGMVEENAAKAVAEINTRGSAKQAHVDLFNALKKWGVVDSVAANQWFTENQGGMDQVQKDASARAFFELALSYGEPDGAEPWALKVQNEKLKELLLSKLPRQETPPAQPAH